MISSNYILLGISGFIIVIFFIIYFRGSLFNAPVTVVKTIKNPRKPGIIDNKELRNRKAGFVDSRGQLKKDVPVEAIDGVSYKKGIQLRRQGYSKVGDLLRKQTRPIQDKKKLQSELLREEQKTESQNGLRSFLSKVVEQPKKLNPIKRKPKNHVIKGETAKASDKRRKQIEQGKKTKEYYSFYLKHQGLEKLPKNSRMTSLEIANLIRTIDKSSDDYRSQDQIIDEIDLKLSYDENKNNIEERYGKAQSFQNKKQLNLGQRDFLEQQPVNRKTGVKRFVALPKKQIDKDLNEDSNIIFAEPNEAWLLDPEYSDIVDIDTKGNNLNKLKKEVDE